MCDKWANKQIELTLTWHKQIKLMFVRPIDTHKHILKPMYNWACPRTYIHICNSMYVCMKCKYIFVWSFIYTWNICYKPFLLSSQHLPLSMNIHTNIYPVVSQHYVFTQLSKVDVVWYVCKDMWWSNVDREQNNMKID